MTDNESCLIWPKAHARKRRVDSHQARAEGGRSLVPFIHIESARTDGEYCMHRQYEYGLLTESDGDAVRARLTTMLVDDRDQHGEGYVPEVTPELIDRARGSPPLTVHERADRLLRFMMKRSPSIGERLDLTEYAEPNPDFERAMAWSESTKPDELRFLLKYLVEQRWVSATRTVAMR